MRRSGPLVSVAVAVALAAAGPALAASAAPAGTVTYANSQYAFSLQYPAGLAPEALDGPLAAGAGLGPDSATGTGVVRITVFNVDRNGGDVTGQPYPLWFTADVRVVVLDDPGACFATEGVSPEDAKTVDVGGTPFLDLSYGDAGMQKYTIVESYRVIHGGRCFAVDQYEDGSDYRDESMTPGISDNQLQAYYAEAGDIARSFRFTDGLPSQGPPPPAPPPPPPTTVSPLLPAATLTHLTFAPGTTRIVASGTVSAAGGTAYQVGAAAGQPLMANVQSASGTETLSITGVQDGTHLLEPGHKADWRGMLTATQDYVIQVNGGIAGEAFTLAISAPAPVRFDRGGVSTQLTGSTPGGLPVDYVVSARAGQALLLDLLTAGAADALQVRGLEDGQTFLSTDQVWLHELYLSLPATEDYLVTVVPRPGSTVAYTLDLMVPAVRLPASATMLFFPALGHAFVVKSAWIAGNLTTKEIYTTADDGKTWHEAASPRAFTWQGASVDLPLPGFIREVHFLSPDEVYVCANNGGGTTPALLKSVDGGAHWTSLKLPDPPRVDATPTRDVDTLFLSFDEGGERGQVTVDVNLVPGGDRKFRYVTEDGGLTWARAAP